MGVDDPGRGWGVKEVMENAMSLIVATRGEPREPKSAVRRRSVKQMGGEGGEVTSPHAIEGIDRLFKSLKLRKIP